MAKPKLKGNTETELTIAINQENFHGGYMLLQLVYVLIAMSLLFYENEQLC